VHFAHDREDNLFTPIGASTKTLLLCNKPRHAMPHNRQQPAWVLLLQRHAI
jgi:hypothetical protein